MIKKPPDILQKLLLEYFYKIFSIWEICARLRPELKKNIDDLTKLAQINELVTQHPLSRDFALKYKRTWKKKKG